MEAKRENPHFSIKGFPFNIWITDLISRPGNYHWHDFTEVLFVVEGEAIHRVNGSCFKVRKGDLVIINGLDFHGLYTEPGKRIKMLIIQLPMSFISLYFNDKSTLKIINEEYVLKPVDKNETGIYECIEFILKELKGKNEGYKFFVTSHVYRLLGEISRSRLFNGNARENNEKYARQRHILEKITPAIEYMENEFGSNITLSDAAKIAGIDIYNFCRFFKQAITYSFSQYLLEIRIKNAMHLLHTSDLNVTEIAYSSGFSSTSYFIKKFREKSGTTPLEFRKSYGK